MKYQQIAPPDYLKPYVRYFWTLENDAQAGSVTTFLAIADGFPGLIFQKSQSGKSWMGEETLPPVFLYGQTISHATIQTPCPFQLVGAYFFPHAIKTVFGVDAIDITGSCIDLDTFPASYRLGDKLLDASDSQTRIQVLCDYLWKLARRNEHSMQRSMHYAVQKIIQTGGSISLADLRNEINMTERTMERRFQEMIGMTPKFFSRVRKFQSSLDQLRARDFSNFSDIAFDQEYADQSHFVRAFREFTGETPARFSKKTRELVENFPQLLH